MVYGFNLTRCMICHKDLSAPNSVELGIGPVCGKKFHVEQGMAPDVIARANEILASIQNQGLTADKVAGLNGLGYVMLAKAVAQACADFVFGDDDNGETSTIRFPYESAKVAMMRALPFDVTGRRFDPRRKLWTIRNTQESKAAVMATLTATGRALTCYGVKGFFTIN